MDINQNNGQNEMIPVDYPASNPLILSPSQNLPQINNAYANGYNNFIHDNHINNYGYFYIEPNLIMKLENQYKIIINTKINFSKLRFIPFIIFFIMFGVGGYLNVVTRGACFPVIIIAFIGAAISIFWIAGVCDCCNKYYIFYDTINKNLEFNCMKKIKIDLDLIDIILMEDDVKNSVFYIINKNGEKIKFLEMPLINGIPFKQGENILNDFIKFWKNKENNNNTDKPSYHNV